MNVQLSCHVSKNRISQIPSVTSTLLHPQFPEWPSNILYSHKWDATIVLLSSIVCILCWGRCRSEAIIHFRINLRIRQQEDRHGQRNTEGPIERSHSRDPHLRTSRPPARSAQARKTLEVCSVLLGYKMNSQVLKPTNCGIMHQMFEIWIFVHGGFS